MALLLNELKIPLSEQESSLIFMAAGALHVPASAIQSLTVVRISLDARKKTDVHHRYAVRIELDKDDERRVLARGLPNVTSEPEHEDYTPAIGTQSMHEPVVVAGMGPAGLFAAYTLALYGYRPVVLERGKPTRDRERDVQAFWGGGPLNPESNLMFGEGGAGAFSDGKLTTRVKDPRAREVIRILHRFGAPDEILTLAKPHLGTDLLRGVIMAIRDEIKRLGGEVRLSTRLSRVRVVEGVLKQVEALRLDHSHWFSCCACVLATGQGARDTYAMLRRAGISLQAKPFAVGVRVEHPQELIDKSQYGPFAGHPRLGAAQYRLASRSGSRGVYTFCMCPGGLVVASSSGFGQVVTNGMSYHARDGEYANSAIVVQIDPADFGSDPMLGIQYQADLEERAFKLGGGDYTAPSQRVEDFLKGRPSSGFGAVAPTYRPGVRACYIGDCLPDYVAAAVKEGIRDFGKKLQGFDLADAAITAVESRTSAPVRIVRDHDGQSPDAAGLYPAGEGAGYAGGIVSAAVDGIRAAERIMAKYAPPA